MSEQVVLKVTVGALLRRQFRNYLERAKFNGFQISWHEIKSFVESDFAIRGPGAELMQLKEYINRTFGE